MTLRLKPRSLRMSLTLGYVAVLAAVLGVYILSVYLFQSWQLERQIYHDEVQDMETVEGLLYFDSTGKLLLNEDYHTHQSSHPLVDRLMEVHTLEGRVIYRNDRLGDVPLGGPAKHNEGAGSYNETILQMPDGDRVMRISHVHPVQGVPLLIRIAYSLEPAQDRMLHFLFILLLAIPVTLITAGYAGHRMAKQALAPLDEMASRARTITATSLHERIHVEDPTDEPGQMATVLNGLFERLEDSFAQLQRFTANAAHELRTPLAATRSVGEVALQQSHTKEELETVISSMLEETTRLTQTVDGLLLMSRAEAGHLQLQLQRTSITALVMEIFALLEIVADERHLSLQMEAASPSIWLNTDRTLVRTALLNVIHNAIRFSPPEKTVTVTVAELINDNAVQIVVSDEGPGIPEAEREHVFEVFYRREETRRAHEGSGLGLAIARGALHALGGSIRFLPLKPQGAHCVLRIPNAS